MWGSSPNNDSNNSFPIPPQSALAWRGASPGPVKDETHVDTRSGSNARDRGLTTDPCDIAHADDLDHAAASIRADESDYEKAHAFVGAGTDFLGTSLGGGGSGGGGSILGFTEGWATSPSLGPAPTGASAATLPTAATVRERSTPVLATTTSNSVTNAHTKNNSGSGSNDNIGGAQWGGGGWMEASVESEQQRAAMGIPWVGIGYGVSERD